MQITNLSIRNFKGIRSCDLNNLSNVVIIAGQNGSGKSTILDAIRLFKSTCAGYQENEFASWFGEFGIPLRHEPGDYLSLLNDKSLPLEITLTIRLHKNERDFINQHAEELLRLYSWRKRHPQQWNNPTLIGSLIYDPSDYKEVEEEVQSHLPLLYEELEKEEVNGTVRIEPSKFPESSFSEAMAVAFSTFRLGSIGVVDYHGPHRIYAREVFQSINVNLDSIKQQQLQSALYNYTNKYNNVKSEMAALYVREALAEKAGVKFNASVGLTDTMKELFSVFFPDKKFLGPVPTADGLLEFPVQTTDGLQHDLNDLSSGEKEILFGYLRIRNSAPRYSVIMIDEPELHLNPRLVRRLPDFYARHLCYSLDNQIWLVSHSDALLRDSVQRDGYSTFHMVPASVANPGENQCRKLDVQDDFRSVFLDLVGDLATYKPGEKLVIFEGDLNSEFDVEMVTDLFPEFAWSVNCVSATTKNRAIGLHSLLTDLAKKQKVPFQVFTIVDRDSDQHGTIKGANHFSWSSYHIENYLLDSEAILEAMRSLGVKSELKSLDDVYNALRECASVTKGRLLQAEIRKVINRKLVGCIDLGFEPESGNVLEKFLEAIATSHKRFDAVSQAMKESNEVEKLLVSIESRLNRSLDDGSWIKEFRGRDILRRFVSDHLHGINYDRFAQLLISTMRTRSIRPKDMAEVLQKILAA